MSFEYFHSTYYIILLDFSGRQFVTRLRNENPDEFSNLFVDAQAQFDPNSRSGPDGESNNTEPKNQPPNPPQ